MAKAKAEGDDNGVAADGADLSQMELVRLSLEALGPKAKPAALQEYIKTKFNRDVTKGIISNYKFHLKKKGRVAGRRKPGRPAGSTNAVATNVSVRIDDLEAVRGLVNRLGADGVKRLLNVLG